MEESLCKHKCGCKVVPNQLFCSRCFHNFNPRDSFYLIGGGYLCPLCYPLSKETEEALKRKNEYLRDREISVYSIGTYDEDLT